MQLCFGQIGEEQYGTSEASMEGVAVIEEEDKAWTRLSYIWTERKGNGQGIYLKQMCMYRKLNFHLKFNNDLNTCTSNISYLKFDLFTAARIGRSIYSV